MDQKRLLELNVPYGVGPIRRFHPRLGEDTSRPVHQCTISPFGYPVFFTVMLDSRSAIIFSLCSLSHCGADEFRGFGGMQKCRGSRNMNTA